MTQVGAFVFLLFALAGLAGALSPIPASWWAGAQFRNRNVRVVEGCVQGLERIVHPNEHGLVDTYFRVGAEDFHFNSSPWLPGFHNEDDVIAARDRLKLTLSGKRVLSIERAELFCR